LIAVKVAKVIAPVVSAGRAKEAEVKATPVPPAQEVVTTRANAVKVGPVQTVVKLRADLAKVVDAVKVDLTQTVVKPRGDPAETATVTPLPARTSNQDTLFQKRAAPSRPFLWPITRMFVQHILNVTRLIENTQLSSP
jgi:hypothetical protein